jgi:hypothetical protein
MPAIAGSHKLITNAVTLRLTGKAIDIGIAFGFIDDHQSHPGAIEAV